MTIKFKVWWRQYRPGDVAEMEDGIATTLIQCHRADFVPDDVAPTVADNVPNKAMNKKQVRRKAGV